MRFAMVILMMVLAGCVSRPVTLPAMHGIVNRHQTVAGSSYWKPTADIIAALEADMSQLWVKPDRRMLFWTTKTGRPYWPLSDYFIRYHGTTVNGQRIVVGQAVHRDRPGAARYLAVEPDPPPGVFLGTSIDVAGGGEAYFIMTYDVESKSVRELKFNAPM
jgi:hypothetical protein